MTEPARLLATFRDASPQEFDHVLFLDSCIATGAAAILSSALRKSDHILFSTLSDPHTSKPFWTYVFGLTDKASCTDDFVALLEAVAAPCGSSAAAAGTTAPDRPPASDAEHLDDVVRELLATKSVSDRKIRRLAETFPSQKLLSAVAARIDQSRASPTPVSKSLEASSNCFVCLRTGTRTAALPPDGPRPDLHYTHISSSILPGDRKWRRKGAGEKPKIVGPMDQYLAKRCSCSLFRRAPASVKWANCNPLVCLAASMQEECSGHVVGDGHGNPCILQCLNMRMQLRAYPRMSLRDFGKDGKGHGIVADELIAAQDLVIEYCGRVKTVSQFRKDTLRYHKEGKGQYTMQLPNGHVVDATVEGNWGRFLNHSCSPNCIAQVWQCGGEYRVGIFAKEDIPAGQELCYDYRFEWFEGSEPARCLCGSANCAGFIGKRPEAAEPGKEKASGAASVRKNLRQTKLAGMLPASKPGRSGASTAGAGSGRARGKAGGRPSSPPSVLAMAKKAVLSATAATSSSFSFSFSSDAAAVGDRAARSKRTATAAAPTKT